MSAGGPQRADSPLPSDETVSGPLLEGTEGTQATERANF